MFFFFPTVEATRVADDYASERFRPPAAIEKAISAVEPSAESLRTISLKQRFLGLGASQSALRFLSSPILKHDIARQQVVVVGWDLTVANTNEGLGSVTRQMARKFMRLWQDSENNRLTAEDKKVWFHIVENVDMDAFHRSLERPRYLEGQLAGSARQWFVRWPGEEGSTKVPKELTSQFSLFEKDEWFGAYFLLDEEDQIISVEKAVPVPAPNYAELEDWPPLAP